MKLFRLGIPEMLIIFTIALLIFGPRLPRLYQKIRPSQRQEEETTFPAGWNFVFVLLLALAFLFGVINTLQILR